MTKLHCRYTTVTSAQLIPAAECEGDNSPRAESPTTAACEAERGAQAKLASPTDIISPREGRASKFNRPGQHDSSLSSYMSTNLSKRVSLQQCRFVRGETPSGKSVILFTDGSLSQLALLATSCSENVRFRV